MSNQRPKAAKAPRLTVSTQLDALFDQVGPEGLCLIVAQDLAEAHGLNCTSAGVWFYRWREARGVVSASQRAAQ